MSGKKGTGEAIGELEHDGYRLQFRDDGDDDHYIFIKLVEPDGTEHSIMDARRNYGDAFLAEFFEGRNAETGAAGGTMVDYGIGHFVCDDCHRTWPARRNRTPNEGHDTCPECHDD